MEPQKSPIARQLAVIEAMSDYGKNPILHQLDERTKARQASALCQTIDVAMGVISTLPDGGEKTVATNDLVRVVATNDLLGEFDPSSYDERKKDIRESLAYGDTHFDGPLVPGTSGQTTREVIEAQATEDLLRREHTEAEYADLTGDATTAPTLPHMVLETATSIAFHLNGAITCDKMATEDPHEEYRLERESAPEKRPALRHTYDLARLDLQDKSSRLDALTVDPKSYVRNVALSESKLDTYMKCVLPNLPQQNTRTDADARTILSAMACAANVEAADPTNAIVKDFVRDLDKNQSTYDITRNIVNAPEVDTADTVYAVIRETATQTNGKATAEDVMAAFETDAKVHGRTAPMHVDTTTPTPSRTRRSNLENALMDTGAELSQKMGDAQPSGTGIIE